MGPCEHRATCFIDIIHLVAYYYKQQDTFSLKFPPIRTKKKSVRGSGDLNSNHEKKKRQSLNQVQYTPTQVNVAIRLTSRSLLMLPLSRTELVRMSERISSSFSESFDWHFPKYTVCSLDVYAFS